MKKWVYTFGRGSAEGRAEMRELLGGKGAGLAEMSNLGLPVPPGLTITAEVCAHYYGNGGRYPEGLREQVSDGVARMEQELGSSFGDAERPLLLSVRSGARTSMPGMMDTVLNLGLNDATVEGLARRSGDARFAFDSFRRFIQMYANVVLDLPMERFERVLADTKRTYKVKLDTELSAEALRELCVEYKSIVRSDSPRVFPDQPGEQLWGAVGAVFGSWQARRAVAYRRLHGIPEHWGTAVNVQAMVFGNMGMDSATGVAFTRDPSTGENSLYGEYLVNAQGEDVVAGIRTPQSLTVAGKRRVRSESPAMQEAMPEAYDQLARIAGKLEAHYRDMQDIEFTVQAGTLWILQTRNAKRSAAASLRVAVEMAEAGLIGRSKALDRVKPSALQQMLHPRLDPGAERRVLTRGLPASPGGASGQVAFTADEAELLAQQGTPVILVRAETSPEDIHGMAAARGILTSRGGMTSHAAVVARGMGRACVCGAGEIVIDAESRTLRVGASIIGSGDHITLDGSSGEVIAGKLDTIEPELPREFTLLLSWPDEVRRLGVRANAETPEDARAARRLGAQGIGLCRTEHMFFKGERILAMREMIVASDEAGRRRALAKILPMQRADFVEIFEIMQGFPVTVRLLDPPLHEFLPHTNEEVEQLAKATAWNAREVRLRVQRLREANPMLGHRGCRLGITYPEIYETQARAIFEAACEVVRQGRSVKPEIMIPLVATRAELGILREQVTAVAEQVSERTGISLDYKVGTMIEVPRAALIADDIAAEAEFFSFGTNDLTQTTFGVSRDDSASFLQVYQDRGILSADPFVSLDVNGVGQLIQLAATRGRDARPGLSLGICGEHGGDPASIAFCERVGLDYVSCSPFRVPVARLAAAQAVVTLARKRGKKVARSPTDVPARSGGPADQGSRS